MSDIRTHHDSRTWWFARPRVAALLLALALAGPLGACQQDQPPPAPAVEAEPPPAPVPPPPPPSRHVVHLAWSFDVGADRCVATAAGHLTTLTVTVRRNATVDLNLAFRAPDAAQIAAGSAAHLRFSGPSGKWNLQASGTARHGIGVSSRPDEMSFGRVLILLGGGVLDVAASPPVLASVQLPPAGPEGQTWFDCARHQMI